MIQLEGRPQREVEGAAAHGLQRVRKRMKARMAEALRPDDDSHPRNESGKNTSKRANEVVVDRPLQKQGSRNQQSYNPDAAEELGPDPVFERSLGFGKLLGKAWSRWVFSARRRRGTGRRRCRLPQSRERLCAQFSQFSQLPLQR